MSDKILQRAVIALGFFDGVHLGHKAVIDCAKQMSKRLCAKTIAFTFEGNLKRVFISGETNVFSLDERKNALFDSGVDDILLAPISTQFLSLSAREFLDWLTSKYNVCGFVSGDDYTFGKNGLGNVKFLQEYANEKGIEIRTVSGVEIDGERVSSTAIKSHLIKGEIERANKLLGRKYSVSGVVYEDRKIGKSLGFPTINIKIDKEKTKLKDGVYAGTTSIDGRTYRAVINYGARPTFDLEEKLIEAHLIGFSGNLYGKTVTLEFSNYIRGIMKFDNVNELICRLAKDVELTESGEYD